MPARTLKYILWSKYFYQDVTVVYDFETMFEKLEEAELKLEKKKKNQWYTEKTHMHVPTTFALAVH